jgi:hypothetical protein
LFGQTVVYMSLCGARRAPAAVAAASPVVFIDWARIYKDEKSCRQSQEWDIIVLMGKTSNRSNFPALQASPGSNGSGQHPCYDAIE